VSQDRYVSSYRKLENSPVRQLTRK